LVKSSVAEDGSVDLTFEWRNRASSGFNYYSITAKGNLRP
jgi:hypothetical protein